MLDKTYLPADIESKIYRAWEAAGHFACAPKSGKAPYCVMMPPPNVTGSLHMGHALNSTLQDVLTRYRRKKGRDSLWQPGMDHAGIATQMVVERQLAEENVHRRDLGREAFVARVWRWKEESGGAIANQLRRLGASPDWSRDRFTMDEGLSHAVRTVFVALYEEGLIYRDKRLVNWDPKLHTAISDLEVEARESDGHLWHFRYPIEGREGKYITVATTRPETMLGDTAVAVHPDDARWKSLVGGHATLPLVGRRLIVVADEHADPEQGSGAVKITPAHDFNDFEVGRRHDLELVNIFDADACLNDNVPKAYRGLERYAARQKVAADMEALGLVEKIEPHRHALPYGDRSGAVVEPWLTDQWFVDAKTLAKPAIAAVETGRIHFVPKQWENTYFEWMRNIQPWCISRQLWWGHRIPAWYGPDQTIFVAMDETAAREKAKAHYGEALALTQDSDVLDTWFSSGLWPFSTLGWPEKTEALETYYPNDDLITGFDIIFFWVARMIMLGMHFMGDVPFRTVYIHALVRDAEGRKMSKSKGNVIDPLELIENYGADAMRFTLAAMEAQGRDIKMSESRVEGYRNFATKLWNAARFCEANGCVRDSAYDPAACAGTVNRWIVGETARAAAATTEALEAYRFNEAANAVYQFAWGVFCDWFVEFSKPVLNGSDGAAKDETGATAAWVLEQILNLLHPFMPFVTEELWGRLEDDRSQPLISAPWPELDDAVLQFEEASAEIGRVVALVSGVRAARAEMNVPAGAKIPLLLRGENGFPDWAENQRQQIVQLARLESMAALDGAPPKGSVQLVIDGDSVALPLAGIIDVERERIRLEKELARIAQEIAKIEAKLANEKFLAKAPEHVVTEQRRRKSEAEAALINITEAVNRVDAL
ncbi:MAG: valine--tRNA ligase [Alphaproteobacteria bacterium]